MVELLRALCAGQDVVAGIVFSWARLLVKGSTVDELLVAKKGGEGRGSTLAIIARESGRVTLLAWLKTVQS